MFKKILVAYDGSEGGKLALGKAREIAQAAKAGLHLLAVGRIPEYAETSESSRDGYAVQMPWAEAMPS